MKFYLLAFLFIINGSVYAEITKWVDENNKVHYSDLPPPGNAKAKKLLNNMNSDDMSASEAESTSSEEPKSIAEREAELKLARKEKQEATDKAAEQQVNEKINQVNCDNAKKTLKTLQADGRISDIDDNGERYYLEDAQRQQHISKTQEDIGRLCK